MVTHVLVISYVNNCYVFYMWLPLKSMRKLQLVKNMATQAILGIPKMAHNTLMQAALGVHLLLVQNQGVDYYL